MSHIVSMILRNFRMLQLSEKCSRENTLVEFYGKEMVHLDELFCFAPESFIYNDYYSTGNVGLNNPELLALIEERA